MRYLLLVTALFATNCHKASRAQHQLESSDDAAFLRAAVTRAEVKLPSSATEVLTFSSCDAGWRAVEARYTVQSGECFYKSVVAYSETNIDQILLSAYDGRTYTLVEPAVRVQRRTDGVPDRGVESLYEPLLAEVGCTMPLSEFLSGESVLEEVSVIVKRENEDTFAVRRTSALPGSESPVIVDLRVKVHDNVEVLGAWKLSQETGRPEISVRVADWTCSGDETRYTVLCSSQTGAGAEADLQSQRMVRVDSKVYSPSGDSHEFQINEYKGNPLVETYHAGVLASTAKYHPDEQPQVQAMPAYLKWFLINDLLLAVVLLTAGVKWLGRNRRPARCSSARE